uniref:Putative transcription factor n=1 Tax=Rhipicephalus microplus TaxID=6941 RepID=A0A6G5AAK1_RHIMP
MPELSAQDSSKREPKVEDKVTVEDASDTDSGSDDSVPDLDDDIGKATGQSQIAQAAGITEELVSKAKQSRSEKKARKLMSKLGLKQVQGVCRVTIRKSKTSSSSSPSQMCTRAQRQTPTLYSERPRLRTSVNKPRWQRPRSSRHLTLAQRWVSQHRPQCLNLSKRSLKKMKRWTRQEWRLRISNSSCLKPTSLVSKQSGHSRTTTTISSMQLWNSRCSSSVPKTRSIQSWLSEKAFFFTPSCLV